MTSPSRLLTSVRSNHKTRLGQKPDQWLVELTRLVVDPVDLGRVSLARLGWLSLPSSTWFALNLSRPLVRVGPLFMWFQRIGAQLGSISDADHEIYDVYRILETRLTELSSRRNKSSRWDKPNCQSNLRLRKTRDILFGSIHPNRWNPSNSYNKL